jgi:DNA-binding GntR family transcriptional regulator
VSIPQRGKFIAALTAKEIRDSYFIGGVLEGAIVASTIDELTDEDFQKLQDILEQMRLLAESGEDREKLAPLDNKFHDILFSKTDNSLVVELSRRSCRGVSKFLLFKYWRDIFTTAEIYERHKVILDVLRTKDPVAIEQCLREHYIDAGRRMMRYGVDVMAKDG